MHSDILSSRVIHRRFGNFKREAAFLTEFSIRGLFNYIRTYSLNDSTPQIVKSQIERIIVIFQSNHLEGYVPAIAAFIFKQQFLDCDDSHIPTVKLHWEVIYLAVAATFFIASSYVDDDPFDAVTIAAIFRIRVSTLNQYVVKMLKFKNFKLLDSDAQFLEYRQKLLILGYTPSPYPVLAPKNVKRSDSLEEVCRAY